MTCLRLVRRQPDMDGRVSELESAFEAMGIQLLKKNMFPQREGRVKAQVYLRVVSVTCSVLIL